MHCQDSEAHLFSIILEKCHECLQSIIDEYEDKYNHVLLPFIQCNLFTCAFRKVSCIAKRRTFQCAHDLYSGIIITFLYHGIIMRWYSLEYDGICIRDQNIFRR